jgi:aryl-alcohol dehydrogenase-like predicted oxidoreductase
VTCCLPRRKLGTQGLVTGAIGLGTMGMTMAYGAGDEPGGIAAIRRAYEHNRAAVSELTALAATKGVTVTQLALAWLLAQGDDIVPIPGTRSARRVAENVAAAFVTLTADDLTRIREVLPHGAAGTRYPASMMPIWA